MVGWVAMIGADGTVYMTQAEAARALGWRIDRLGQAVRRGALRAVPVHDEERGRERRLLYRQDIETLRHTGRLPSYQPVLPRGEAL